MKGKACEKWESVGKCGKYGEYGTYTKDVVEMSYYIICIMKNNI
jgi:hypothetical protein